MSSRPPPRPGRCSCVPAPPSACIGNGPQYPHCSRVGITNEDPARPVDSNASHSTADGGASEVPIGSCQRGDDACGIDSTDPLFQAVRKVETPGVANCQTIGIPQRHVDGPPAVPAVGPGWPRRPDGRASRSWRARHRPRSRDSRRPFRSSTTEPALWAEAQARARAHSTFLAFAGDQRFVP